MAWFGCLTSGTMTQSTRFRDSRHTQVSFSQFEGKVCFAQNVASA